jgi:hypothetical protein
MCSTVIFGVYVASMLLKRECPLDSKYIKHSLHATSHASYGCFLLLPDNPYEWRKTREVLHR